MGYSITGSNPVRSANFKYSIRNNREYLCEETDHDEPLVVASKLRDLSYFNTCQNPVADILASIREYHIILFKEPFGISGCDGRMVKALGLYSSGLFQHSFECCSLRLFYIFNVDVTFHLPEEYVVDFAL